MIPVFLEKSLDKHYAGVYKRREQEMAKLLRCHPWEIVSRIQHLQRERDEAVSERQQLTSV